MKLRKASLYRRHRAVTRLEVIVILSVIVLCAALIPMTFLRRTELQRRGVCIQNLSLIGTALYTYSNENHDMFPIAAHPAATKDRVGNVEYVRQIGAYRGRWTDPQAGNTDRMPVPPDHLSTTRNLWTLFRLGLITRDKFICPSTRDVANQEPKAERYWDFGVDDVEGPVTAEQSRVGASQVSYGYQMPYGKQGQPNVGYDKPGVVADKGPFGAWLETGSAPPPAVFPAADDARRWRPWNSPSHDYEGQMCSTEARGPTFRQSRRPGGPATTSTRSSVTRHPEHRLHGRPDSAGKGLRSEPVSPRLRFIPRPLILPMTR